MTSLRTKLILAFLVVSISGVALAFLLATRLTEVQFNRLLRDQGREEFISQVTTYYEAQGTWQGITTATLGQPLGADQRPAPGPLDDPALRPEQAMSPGGQPMPPPFVLANGAGRILLAPDPAWVGRNVPAEELARGLSLEVDGRQVGTVLDTATPPPRNDAEELFLAGIRRILLLGAVGAAVLALGLGMLMARALTRPLQDLTRASRAMAAGALDQQVSVRSRDELGELATAFNQMSADLVKSNRQRQQMTADIAHDLRTPLTVLSGYLEAMQDGDLAPTAARLRLMDGEVQVLRRLVDDLRTLSLADAGQLALNRQLLQPEALLQRVAASYQYQAKQQSIDLHLDIGPDLPAVHGDLARLVQMMGNLVGNALRYTPEGGRVTLGARSANNGVVLSVADTGQGIARDHLDQIFERFYRVDPSRADQGGQSGLGLAIAKSIVEAHGGNISVESQPGRGTTFTIRLSGSPVDEA